MNTVAIKEDEQGNRFLILHIKTFIAEEKRMQVLMSAAGSHLTMVEHTIAKLPHEEIERLHEELEKLAESQKEEPKEVSPILAPDFAPASSEIIITDK